MKNYKNHKIIKSYLKSNYSYNCWQFRSKTKKLYYGLVIIFDKKENLDTISSYTSELHCYFSIRHRITFINLLL